MEVGYQVVDSVLYFLVFGLGILIGMASKIEQKRHIKSTWVIEYYKEKHNRWEDWGESDKFRHVFVEWFRFTIHGRKAKIRRYRHEA